ncbi:hypothetical protein EIP91_004081 [Steccherinum ochraceum]|uniref:FAD-binding PCMH-type domain-containing protein n=1 Tax=Steccherinum ochraceum TaxID=92696 RepID=A0A4R0RBY1_9APHY|nr:hypothetical protein EIP91_004081 [Steccherinum ochraceum]
MSQEKKPPTRKTVQQVKYERGRSVYLVIVTATIVLGLSSNPFGLLDNILPASWSAKLKVPRCRCLYGDTCWPSEATFAALAAEVSQPLIYPKPFASACYSPSNSSEECDAVLNHNVDGVWHSNQPGSMQSRNFETYVFPNGTISACYPNSSLGAACEQGSVPVIGVDARTADDVSYAVRFAARNNLRLVIKNTGHDCLGRSSARGSFMLWTHHLKDIEFHETFTPAGSKEVYEKVLTLSAGVQWYEAYETAAKHDRVIVGGLSPGQSNGAAGGWVLGGGHSIISPMFGLGVDNVVEMTVVIANGEILTVNAQLYPDLFWALRGGGGGTFGVLTSVTYKTHPTFPVICGYMSTVIDHPSKANATPVLTKLVTEFMRISPQLADAGWSGYPVIQPDPVTKVPSMWILLIAPNTSWARANGTLNPFFAYARSLAATSKYEDDGSLVVKMGGTYRSESYAAWEKVWLPKVGLVGDNMLMGSRLIPRNVVEQKYEELGALIATFPSTGFFLVSHGKTSEFDPDSVAVHPAWRNTFMHVAFWGTWTDGASAEHIKAVDAWVKDNTEKLTAFAPDTGAYFNEAYMHEANPQQTFFGSHYERLLAIKAKYDPRSLFIVGQGVGHEQWDDSLNCRL